MQTFGRCEVEYVPILPKHVHFLHSRNRLNVKLL
jgi:hypothetical protein